MRIFVITGELWLIEPYRARTKYVLTCISMLVAIIISAGHSPQSYVHDRHGGHQCS